jgi:signal transduction histidine kinase
MNYVAVRNQHGTQTNKPVSLRKSKIRSVSIGAHKASKKEVSLRIPLKADGAKRPDLLEGFQSLSKFGHTVSEAGDVNRDGFDDVIVGAPSAGTEQSGAVFLFLGGVGGISKTPAWRFECAVPRAELGHQVAGAGDVNGDGYDDLLVGASYYSPPGQPERTGAAFVFLGGPNGPGPIPDWQVEGSATGDNTGFSVGAAGDINGDGFDDVLVGSWNAESNRLVKDQRKGSAALYFGGPTGLSKTPAWQPEGEKLASHYGYSLHGIGDINGDGFDDIAIGAWGFETERFDSGRVYVYLGGLRGPSSVPAWVLTGVLPAQRIGASVYPAGDVNSDGFADLLVGVPGSSVPETYEGMALLFLGSPEGLSTEASWNFEPNREHWGLGHSVATTGDLNGDGFSDIVISSMVGDANHPSEGLALVFFGSKMGPGRSPDWVFGGQEPKGGYGATVRPAGDVNRDGYDDLIVGQTYHTGALFQQGAAWVHYGGPGGLAQGMPWRHGFERIGFRYRSVTVPLPTFLGRAVLGMAAVAAIGLAAVSLHRRAVRRQQSLRLAAEAAQRTERKRLSEDLHDQLGSEITDLVITSSLIRRNLEAGKSPHEPLVRLETVSRGLMDSLGEIVWLTQPHNDRLDRVAGYLGDLAEKMLEPAEIECQLEIPSDLPDIQISYDCRHDLVLAVREALNNCIRHASTRRVLLRIRSELPILLIEIEDFGKGFSKGKPHARGHGLQNLSNRLERHGGIADIQTGTEGTRVSLRLPLTTPLTTQ